MCIKLWRRYLCPKAPRHTPLDASRCKRVQHPEPKESIHDHHLLLEDGDTFRENAEDPDDACAEGFHIHWIRKWIRCAHLHHDQCLRFTDAAVRIQHIRGSCPTCTGDIDVHVEDIDRILRDVSKHPTIPVANEKDEQLDIAFEAYKEYYLLQLLRLLLEVLKKPWPMTAGSADWYEAIRVTWPEMWCKEDSNHIANWATNCDCTASMEEWRVNTSFSMRKNEAGAVLARIEQEVTDGEPSRFWDAAVIRTNEHTGEVTAEFDISADALQLIERFPDHGYPDDIRFMPYVNIPELEYVRRLNQLRGLSRRCRAQLSARGKSVSQSYPPSASFETRRLVWLDKDDWELTLNRRQYLLEWVYQFLARDAGLDERVMMYLGGTLLALLNPFPNNHHNNHPSHPNPQCLDNELAAWDVLQECVFWLEFHWPLTGRNHIIENLVQSTEETTKLLRIIERNRAITMRDTVERSRAAQLGASVLRKTEAEAEADGHEQCICCAERWGFQPFHEPVKMPCCKNYVGLRCLKNWMAAMPLRNDEDTAWAVNWRCMFCRAEVGQYFAPTFRPRHGPGPVRIGRDTFHNRMESYADPGLWADMVPSEDGL